MEDRSDSIYEYSPAGSRSTFYTGSNLIFGVALDSSGNVYAAQPFVHQILKITPGAGVSVFADATSGLVTPVGMKFGPNGDLYVADDNNTIEEITPAGVETTFYYGGLHSPNDVAFDKSGNLYISDSSGTSIFEVTPSGTKSTFAGGLSAPEGIAFDASGNLYVANQAANNLIKITPTGSESVFATGLNEPVGVAVDRLGNVFVGNYGTNSVLEYAPSGVPSTFASGLNGPEFLAFSVPAATPEPGTLALIGSCGIVAFGLLQRRRRK